jgi:hypothetical protein
MEGQVVSDLGLEFIANQLATVYGVAGLKIHLFKSDTVPSRTTVLGDLDECDFSGYSSQLADTWSYDSTTGHIALDTNPSVTFTRVTGGISNNVFGYYITDSTDTVLLWSERAVPAADHVGTVMSLADQTIVVTPRQDFRSLLP